MIDETATIAGLARATGAHRKLSPRGPLPHRILAMATSLCRAGHPAADVAKAARMSVDLLSRRLSGGPNRVKRVARTRAKFVALRQARPSGPANPSWIEIERADGAKLRLPDINPSEAFALFLGGRT